MAGLESCTASYHAVVAGRRSGAGTCPAVVVLGCVLVLLAGAPGLSQEGAEQGRDAVQPLFQVLPQGVVLQAEHLPLGELGRFVDEVAWGLSRRSGPPWALFVLPATVTEVAAAPSSADGSRHPARLRIGGVASVQAQGGGQELAGAAAQVSPWLGPPRIWLSAEVFAAAQAGSAEPIVLRPADVPVDVVTDLLRAYLEALLRDPGGDAALRDRLAAGRRALPADSAAARYDTAVLDADQYAQVAADYAAHVLAVYNSVFQWVQRNGGPSERLCGLLARDLGLTVPWRAALAPEPFLVDRPAPSRDSDQSQPVAGASAAAQTVARGSRRPIDLTLIERQMILRRLLNHRWSGRPEVDLAGIACP